VQMVSFNELLCLQNSSLFVRFNITLIQYIYLSAEFASRCINVRLWTTDRWSTSWRCISK